MRYCLCNRYRSNFFLIFFNVSILFASTFFANNAAANSIEQSDANRYESFAEMASSIWGENNVWMPSPKVYVQYEKDLGERSAVDYEKGIATVEILIDPETDQTSDLVLAHLRQGVGNLILSDGSDIFDMMETFVATKKRPVEQDKNGNRIPPSKVIRVYIVQKGDSLWKVAKRFCMTTKELAEINDIEAETILSVGRPLKVAIFSSHDLTLDSEYPQPSTKPLLLDQIRMVDGSPVPHWMVENYAAEVIEKSLTSKMINGADGVQRKVVSVSFKLISNHLELRARKYFPLVKSRANDVNLDPALVMAIIHTESMFNPRARSAAPAYGLMQLVPHTGAREAYRKLYGKKRKISSEYLYDPENNIELGMTYFNIIKESYLKSISDPISRTYCAVAAYNTGTANVGNAFISRKSIIQASTVINTLIPEDVFTRLVKELPSRESRKYVKKVLELRNYYERWI